MDTKFLLKQYKAKGTLTSQGMPESLTEAPLFNQTEHGTILGASSNYAAQSSTYVYIAEASSLVCEYNLVYS